MAKYLMLFLNWIKSSKLKFALAIFSALVFLFILFPFEDLSDLFTSRISKLTHNQIYVQFETLEIKFLPEPGVEFFKVYLETPSTPPLSAKELGIFPSIMGLITKKPAGSVEAKGLFQGDLEVNLKSGTKSESGLERQKISLKADKMSLQELRSLGNIPVMLKGQININTLAQADLTFSEQPEADLNVEINKFELPPANIATPMGPLSLPDLKLTKVELKGRLSNGRFNVETGTLGKEGDELTGVIKGGIAMTLSNTDGHIAPIMGAYSFDIKLNVKPSFQDKASLFLSFLEAYKAAGPNGGASYSFKVGAPSLQAPPNITQ